MDAVCADGAGVEHAQRIEVFDGRHAVFLAHDAHLVLRLGDMGHQVQSVPLGRLFAAPQVFGRHGVGRMGREGDPDPVAAGGEFHRLPHFGKHLFDVAVKIVAAQHRTDAQPLGHFDAAVLVVILSTNEVTPPNSISTMPRVIPNATSSAVCRASNGQI